MTTATTTTADSHSVARLRAALERELAADEAALWHGWQLARIEPRMFLTYIFAIPWTAFSVLWTTLAAGAVGAMGDDGPGLIGWAFPLVGLPFVAIGIGMLAQPFVPFWQGGRVLFVVTDRRVLRFRAGRSLSVDAVPADRIGFVRRRERPDGSGELALTLKAGRGLKGTKRLFCIGTVEDVTGAQAAVDAIIARVSAGPGRAGALSS